MNKRSNATPGSRSTGFAAAVLAALALLPIASQVQAKTQYLGSFNTAYPGSSSGTNANCQLCHGSSTSTLNQYGRLWNLNSQNFTAVEGEDSININGGTTMLDEINASTQPGWTTGINNLYSYSGTLISTETAPSGIGDLDPAPVVANQPPVAVAVADDGIVNELVMFDGSDSDDPDGSIASFDWDFGDGASGTGVSPTHTYAAVGIYDVTLTVTDDDGAKGTDSTTAEIVAGPQDPVADPGGPYKEIVNTALALDGSGSNDPDGGDITQYDWDFGDGRTGTGVAPTHTYDETGTYTVTLIVVDDEGKQSEPATTTAEIVLPQDPVADPGGPYRVVEGRALTLDGSGSNDPDGGDIAQYNWDFGDDTTGTGVEPTHTYTTAGTYTVTLVVVDEEGAQSAPVETEVEVTTASSDNGGCSVGGRGAFDPALPLLVLVALLYLARRRVFRDRLCDPD
jgi:PKD repeat protein